MLKVKHLWAALGLVALVAVSVGMSYALVASALATGPYCPAPVPSDWLGFCNEWTND